MNVWENRDLQLLNERLRNTQEENRRLIRNAEINRAVIWSCVAVAGILLLIRYGSELWTILRTALLILTS